MYQIWRFCLFLADEEKNCIDSHGRLLFRKPKEKSDECQPAPSKSDIVEIASNKTAKRKNTTHTEQEGNHGNSSEKKKAKAQLLSFMDESGIDGDDWLTNSVLWSFVNKIQSL